MSLEAPAAQDFEGQTNYSSLRIAPFNCPPDMFITNPVLESDNDFLSLNRIDLMMNASILDWRGVLRTEMVRKTWLSRKSRTTETAAVRLPFARLYQHSAAKGSSAVDQQASVTTVKGAVGQHFGSGLSQFPQGNSLCTLLYSKTSVNIVD